MKSTRLKISVSQDGLLPQETAEIATLEFPALPKKLLKALGFERVDARTYVGVLPVFINLGEKDQEIEIELGVTLPEMRKKIIEIVKTPARLISVAEDKKPPAAASKKKKAPVKAKPKARPRARAVKVTRLRLVWGVFNNSNQCVATYEYPRRQEADDHAARLSADKRSTHFVQPVKEPIEEKKDK